MASAATALGIPLDKPEVKTAEARIRNRPGATPRRQTNAIILRSARTTNRRPITQPHSTDASQVERKMVNEVETVATAPPVQPRKKPVRAAKRGDRHSRDHPFGTNLRQCLSTVGSCFQYSQD